MKNRIAHLFFIYFSDSLEWLILAENQLSRVPSDALHLLVRLRLLDLRFNNITSIDASSFASYGQSLKFLHLQNNK